MRIRLLPASVNNPKHLQPLTTFLINDTVAVDGGSLGLCLGPEAQRRVQSAIITHTHLDHVASLPIHISEVFPCLEEPFRIYATRHVIDALTEHIFNYTIWPAFQEIRLMNGNGMGLRYIEIEPMVPFHIDSLRITPVSTNHTVPTVGLVVESERAAVIMTSDTSHTEEIWSFANQLQNLMAVFVDVSYPNELEDLAEESKHLTPQGLDLELCKLVRSVPVFAVHLKPQHHDSVVRQLQVLNRSNVFIGEIDQEYVFPPA